MAETMPDDSFGPPVEGFARSLLACAREQPSLLVRPPAAPNGALDGALEGAPDGSLPGLIAEMPHLITELPRSLGRQGRLLPGRANRPLERSPYLEELVSIAVTTARHAEDAARRASDACALARRDRLAWAGFGVLGIVIGVAGVVDAHWIQDMRRRPVEIARLADPVQGQADGVQGQADGVAESAVGSDTPVSLQATTAGPSPRASVAESIEAPLPAAIPIAVRPTWSIDSAGAPPRDDVIAYDPPPPRPKYRPQRNHRINVARHRPVVLTRFFATLRRDVRSIFQ